MIYYETCFEKYKHDTRKTWSTINGILKKTMKKKSIPEVFKENGNLLMVK